MKYDIKKRAKEILDKMNFSDKIGQVTQATFNASNIEEACQMVRTIKPGSLILCWSPMGGNEEQRSVCVEHLNQLQKAAIEETEAGIPILFGRDVIHGHRVAFPVPLTMTSSYDFDLMNRCFDAIREEAIADGIKWTFSPMLDMARDSRWGRMVEGTGEDPYLGSLYAKAAITGFQTEEQCNEKSMIACAKHYVGYGASEGGRDYNHSEISDYALQNYYLPAFRTAVDCGVGTIMSGFNDVNGIPVTGSRRILTEILRDELGFQGFVVSDWEAIAQMHKYCGFTENERASAKEALHAGVDMDMVCNCYLEEIAQLIEDGEVMMEELDTAVLRILETKLRFGLFDYPYAQVEQYDLEEHLKLAQEMAEKSIVLLKNEDNILPLAKTVKLGYAGNFKDEGIELAGTWSLDFDKSLIHSIRQGIQSVAPECRLFDCDDTNAYRVAIKKDTDCILVVIGEKRELTGEASNVADISISSTQRALLQSLKRAGRPVIGVLCFARPIALGADDELFDAILYCGHGGTRAAEAIGAVLFGDVEPQGRLPFTLPYDIGQLPIYYNALPGSRKMNGYYKDINPDHADYYNCTGAPSYPFGYGLAYTDFEFGMPLAEQQTLALTDIEQGETFKVKATVTNTGERFGVAVLQLYIRDLHGCRVRPLRVLRNFTHLQLQPGESKTVEFEVTYQDLGFWLENGEFIIEKGKFEIYIGENCLTTNKCEVRLV